MKIGIGKAEVNIYALFKVSFVTRQVYRLNFEASDSGADGKIPLTDLGRA